MSHYLDLDLIDQLKLTMAEQFHRLIITFLKEMDHISQHLYQSIQESDHQNVYYWTHMMKGAASTIGAKQLANSCGKLEHLAKENASKNNLKKQYKQITSDQSHTSSALHKLLS
jgi:HPt (histidine-containing phosphotransfer) domain-containing protein